MTPDELFALLVGAFSVSVVALLCLMLFFVYKLTNAINAAIAIFSPLVKDENAISQMAGGLNTIHHALPQILNALMVVNKTMSVFNEALFQKSAGHVTELTADSIQAGREFDETLRFTFAGGKEKPQAKPVVVEPENAPEGSGGTVNPTDEEMVRAEIMQQAKDAGIVIPAETEIAEPPEG